VLRVIGCITQEHDYALLAAAVAICGGGSVLTMMLLARARAVAPARRLGRLGLIGMVAGATIWTTHFVAMLAYDPGVQVGYDPLLTLGSVFIAILGCTAAFALGAAKRGLRPEAGGVLFGLSVTAMHYAGMAAVEAPGRLVFDPAYVFASLVLGAGLGALALNRITRPLTRHCWLGGAVAMTLAIAAMHFTGMAGVSIEMDPTVAAPKRTMSDDALSVIVLSAAMLFLLVGLAALQIDTAGEAEAERRALDAQRRDALTGLPNRMALHRVVDELTAQAEAGEVRRVAVMTLDLDGFKLINDARGHEAGDAALQEIAARFQRALWPGEFIARTGGDEFVAVKTGFARHAEASAFAKRLQTQTLEALEGARLGASVGLAIWPDDAPTPRDALRASDFALHRAKEQSIDRIVRYSADMEAETRARIELTDDLRHAADRDELVLHFQRQNDVATRRVVGFEALLRWRHPARGMVSPGEFIPIAEQTGLILPIGLWVLRTACREAAGWAAPLRIAVNVAPQQLVQPSFVESVADALLEAGLDPRRLELEITEASIIDDERNTLEVIHRLKAMGVRIAMDDFGTGYSSLAALRTFPFDKIKIDRSFVTGARTNRQNAAIVRATVLLGDSLGIPVLAEGVETEDDLRFLAEEHCREVQGFLFGRPVPSAEAAAIAMEAAAPPQPEQTARAIA
jgi:diguanylate cyclase (GGDEF)-like protein